MNLKNCYSKGILVGFVQFDHYSFYCLAEIQYWIGHYWSSYIDLTQGNLEGEYYRFFKKFAVDLADLITAYKLILEEGDLFDIEGNKPMLYLDFQKRYLASSYIEQAIENQIPDGWISEFTDVQKLIPKEFHYWRTV